HLSVRRGQLQDESVCSEQNTHDASLPLIGVNTFLPKELGGEAATEIELSRSTEEEKAQQIANVGNWQSIRNRLASLLPPRAGEGRDGGGSTSHAHVVEDETVADEVHDGHGLAYLQDTARRRGNVCEALVEAVKTDRKSVV